VLGLELRAHHVSSRTEFDGFPPPAFSFADTEEYSEVEESLGYAGLTHHAGRLRNRVGVAYTAVQRTNFDPASAFAPVSFDSTGRNRRFEYQGVFTAGRSRATFGAESERSDISVASAFSPAPLEKAARLDSVYLLGAVEPAANVTLTAGVRRDEHDAFGGATTAQAGLVWAPSGGTWVRANWGRGFKAPSLYQLFSEFGNEALRAEHATGWDLGVERRAGDRLTASATAFGRTTEDQIDFFSCFGASHLLCGTRPFGFYDNVAETRVRGLELAAELRPLEGVAISAAYTWLDSENRGSANRGRTLVRRPDHTLYVAIDRQWTDRLSTGAALQYVDDRFDDQANAFPLQAYTLVDLRVAYGLKDGVDLFGRVENLFDADYESARLYGSVGRGLFVGTRTRF
jgi:vitamin B12 transporter